MDNQVPSKPELAFNKALSDLQGDLQAVAKTSTNPAFKKDGKVSKYADLDGVSSYVFPLMKKYGLSFICRPEITESGNALIRASLKHIEGHSESAQWPLGAASNTSHQLGGANTYGRRQLLMALTGVFVSDDDDDGNTASNLIPTYPEERTPPKPKPKNYAPSSAPLKPETRLEFLTRLVTEKKIDKKKVVQACEMYSGKPTLAKDLTPEQLEQVIKHLSVL